jgi:hypothetical protein
MLSAMRTMGHHRIRDNQWISIDETEPAASTNIGSSYYIIFIKC